MTLAEEVQLMIGEVPTMSSGLGKEFEKRIKEDALTRDENPISHFGVYFLFYDLATKRVFLTLHKKSGLWLSPGGHVDRGETTRETLVREIQEELGFVFKATTDTKSFLLTITPMDHPGYACKTHYDIWYAIPTDGNEFKIDPSEFNEVRWMTVVEARLLVIDESNLEALKRIDAVLEQAPR